MKILITAGGTKEKIDQVRSITNHSSGRLGKAIAEAFIAQGPVQIDYVTTKFVAKPTLSDHLRFHIIESTSDLFHTLEQLLQEQTYDAIIHSMAVSDFTPAFSLSEMQFSERLTKDPLTSANLHDWLTTSEQLTDNQDKISSDTDYLFVALKKTPKIIGFLRKWQPKAKIVGFKLLVDVPKKHLLSVAKKSLATNQTDFVFANDLTQISENKHHGYLISATGSIEEAHTKQEIAQRIVANILN
ncbi:phosphopantothenate--cysteine ligase [Enterococcus hirae]|nr:phosphopantothenate--cysteine ligase [Enterococcus hirae]